MGKKVKNQNRRQSSYAVKPKAPPAAAPVLSAPAPAPVRPVLKAEPDYVDEAERVIEKLAEDGGGKALTSSKIRGALSMTADIYNRVKVLSGSELSEDLKERLRYLRVRFVYEASRDDGLRALVDEADLIERIRSVRNREDCLLLCRFMEALVAFHQFKARRG